jgi:hypothetical protein
MSSIALAACGHNPMSFGDKLPCNRGAETGARTRDEDGHRHAPLWMQIGFRQPAAP